MASYSLEVFMALNKTAILAAGDIKLDKVAVPEWGGDVYLKTISGIDRDQFEEGYSEQKMKNFRARFLVLTLCDEKGDRLFTDAEVAELAKKSSLVLNRLFEKAWGFNAFTNEAVDDLGNDSTVAPSDGSTSA
jgi:hypothetical protein